MEYPNFDMSKDANKMHLIRLIMFCADNSFVIRSWQTHVNWSLWIYEELKTSGHVATLTYDYFLQVEVLFSNVWYRKCSTPIYIK